ncbi:MAG: hypothetical protein PWQ54_1695 [Bacteroidales bacterium]|nr:hypothetical protein [Bacteroidales bacterium]
MVSINRTKLELKLEQNKSQMDKLRTINRTKLELKQVNLSA